MNRRPTQRQGSYAFTLIELLIVISIFVLLLAIAVPAFSSMLYSSEQSMAENALRTGITAARDAAIRSAQGEDAAAVFTFDASAGRMAIIPCVRAGVVRESVTVGARAGPVDREVFVPVTGFEPVQLPRGWAARGYVPEGMIDDGSGAGEFWYATTYSTTTARQRGNWLFPETGFYDEDDPQNNDFENRNTFMVRFEGGTGMLKQDGAPVLVLVMNPSTASRQQQPWSLYPAAGEFPFRPDLEEDAGRFVRRVSSWPVTGAQPLSLADRLKLLGSASGDTVLAKPVGQVALCSEKKLAAAIGVRLDPTTNSLYRDPATQTTIQPEFVQVNGAAWTDAYTIRVNEWIEDRLYLPPAMAPAPGAFPLDTRAPSDCRIFSIQRYLGTLQDISGTVAGQGVSS